MRSAFLALLACTACNGSPSVDSSAEAGAAPRSFASQADVPSPDYAAMRKQSRPAAVVGEMKREASAPLPPDAKNVGQVWIDRLSAKDALGGYGLGGKGPDGPVVMIDTLLTAREFDAWVKAGGWAVPRHIAWSFQNELPHPAAASAASERIRYWPARITRTGMQNAALLNGRVVLRDGCFFLRKFDGSEGLAWFLAETGLAVDPQGFLVLIDRATGETEARVGEMMVWGGPNADPTPEQTRELRKVCGEHPVFDVGNPEAEVKFHARYPHLREPNPAPPPPARPR